MFFENLGTFYKYIPILALNPSEMTAIEQLCDKDKDLLLPCFPLKGWTTAKELKSSIDRIKKSIGERLFIADVDSEFLYGNKTFAKEGEYPRKVHEQIHQLLDPSNGYRNWVSYVAEHENMLPTLLLEDLSSINEQVAALSALERGIVIRFKMKETKAEQFNTVLKALLSSREQRLLFILDYEDIGRAEVIESGTHANFVRQLANFFPKSTITISATSFPFNFAGSHRGEIPIYERQLFNNIKNNCDQNVQLVYSDRGSARAAKLSGGASLPPPRIDYALKHDWRFIRKEYPPQVDVKEGDKERLYQQAALEMLKSDYWNSDLRLWGTQMIEKTALGDSYGITSPNRATAVRINLHVYQQIHYLDVITELDTEEEWID
ncbi:beta family protein [Vibrio campbellii]|uniref:beta family protein n=1 Tax=Vibrio campbellii TaxID=680 RepID=UPI0006944F64|nr:beta family protein [Vibrio campbellii]